MKALMKELNHVTFFLLCFLATQYNDTDNTHYNDTDNTHYRRVHITEGHGCAEILNWGKEI